MSKVPSQNLGSETAESDDRSSKVKIAMRLKLEFLLLRRSLVCSILLRGDSEVDRCRNDSVTAYEKAWDVGLACMDT